MLLLHFGVLTELLFPEMAHHTGRCLQIKLDSKTPELISSANNISSKD
jgi:hypothetical protein